MMFSVDQRVRAIAGFRAAEVRIMEVAAAWTPTTPEMEVKVMFGRHIWEFAQHADALGKRTFELRRPEQWAVPLADSYRGLLDEVAALEATGSRLACLYDAVLPGLVRRYRQYLAATDSLLDGPSVVVIERILPELDRQIADADRLRRELKVAPGVVDELKGRELAIAALAAAEAAA